MAPVTWLCGGNGRAYGPRSACCACCNMGLCLGIEARAKRCAVHGLLQHTSAQSDTGEQNARGPFGSAPPNGARVCNPPVATWACACGKGRSWRCAVHCFCTKGQRLWIQASRMLAVHLGGGVALRACRQSRLATKRRPGRIGCSGAGGNNAVRAKRKTGLEIGDVSATG
jgi:hypothetical protein